MKMSIIIILFHYTKWIFSHEATDYTEITLMVGSVNFDCLLPIGTSVVILPSFKRELGISLEFFQSGAFRVEMQHVFSSYCRAAIAAKAMLPRGINLDTRCPAI